MTIQASVTSSPSSTTPPDTDRPVARVAINGYGRIGRNILRALYESKQHSALKIVAINDVGDADVNVHLTRYDSLHGRFPGTIESHFSGEDSYFTVNGDRIEVCREADPSRLPWAELDIDLVFECTGRLTTRDSAAQHLLAGARKVIISAPASEVDATIVYGVNHQSLTAACEVISNASCTTNCLAPVAQVLHQRLGIISGAMTTVHAYTNDQALHDINVTDKYRSRAAPQSMIPSKTGAALAVGEVLPELAGKLSGMAIRVPTANVSLIDFHFIASRATSVAEVNECMQAAAQVGPLAGLLKYCDEPLVSVDFNHDAASAIFDAGHTHVYERMVKVMAWYDNEWGFSNRMLDTAQALLDVN